MAEFVFQDFFFPALGQHFQLWHRALWFTVSQMMYSDLQAEVAGGVIYVSHKTYEVPNTRDSLNHLTFLLKNREANKA